MNLSYKKQIYIYISRYYRFKVFVCVWKTETNRHKYLTNELRKLSREKKTLFNEATRPFDL